MTITYRAIKGSPLTSDEVDDNFHDIDDRVTDIEDNPPAANGIANIVVVGTQMTIVLEDATELGPYTLPQANFRPAITETLVAATDGTYHLVAADANKYKRYAGSSDVTVVVSSGLGLVADAEIYFRVLGTGNLSFEGSTDVTINPPTGFLALTDGGGVILKYVGSEEFDLEVRLTEDVTA